MEDLLQPGHVLGGEPLFDAVHHRGEVLVADVVVVVVLLGDAQVKLPLVVVGLLPGEVALFHEAVDLVGGVGRGDVDEVGKLVDGGLVERLDDLHAEGLHRGEAGLPVPDAAEHLLVEVQLEFGIHVGKFHVQHRSLLTAGGAGPLREMTGPGGAVPGFFLIIPQIPPPRKRRAAHWMAKVSSARQATWPSTVASATPKPMGPRR